MSDFWLQPDYSDAEGADDAEDDDAGDPVCANGRDATIYVVDAKVMEEIEMRDIREIIEKNMKNRIVQSDRDLVGIIVYNTEFSPPPDDDCGGTDTAREQTVPEHMAIVLPLQEISVDCIEYVRSWGSWTEDEFIEEYGCIERPDIFPEMLWLCSRMLTGCDYKLYSASIVLMTLETDPLKDDQAATQKAFVRARDLRTLNVDLVLVPMHGCGDFDLEPFYRELICTVSDLDPETFDLMDAGNIMENLTMRSYQRDYRRTCQRYFSLDLGGGVEVGCGLYGLWQKAPLPKRLQLNATDNEVVQVRRCYVRSEPDPADATRQVERVLLPGELTKYQMVGGRKVQFSVEELATVKSAMAPGMRLLGFKPLSVLPQRMSVKPSRLLYPSEKRIKGSTTLLRALWECCLRREVFALCVFSQKRKVAPRYVALVPQEHHTERNRADGFTVIYLPMQTDIRELDIFNRPYVESTDEQDHIMDTLVQKTSFKYEARMFEDPTTKSFYHNLEALVFDQPSNDLTDTSLPEFPQHEIKIHDLLPLLVPAFGEDVPAAPVKRVATSRTDGEGSTAQKNARTSGQVLGLDEMQAAVQSGAVEQFTVTVLRDYLMHYTDLKSMNKLKKADLLDLVRQHCGGMAME